MRSSTINCLFAANGQTGTLLGPPVEDYWNEKGAAAELGHFEDAMQAAEARILESQRWLSLCFP